MWRISWLGVLMTGTLSASSYLPPDHIRTYMISKYGSAKVIEGHSELGKICSCGKRIDAVYSTPAGERYIHLPESASASVDSISSQMQGLGLNSHK